MDFLPDNRTRVFCSHCRAEYLETYGACPACGEASLSALNRVEPQADNPNASCAQCACCGTKYLASGRSCPECGSIATEGMPAVKDVIHEFAKIVFQYYLDHEFIPPEP